MRARAACSDGLRRSDGVERHMVRTGGMHAQPGAITDCGADAVADSCPYDVADPKPNTRAYPRPHAGPDR
jgi:hypothetical protein